MMRSTMFAVSLTACAWGGGPGPGPSDNGAQPDARMSHDAPRSHDAAPTVDAAAPDALAIDAAVDASTPATIHLLLSEVTLAPTGAEFIEILNPTAAAVDLSTYYLANHGSYFKLPAGNFTVPQGHFVVQFSAGTMIPAGGAITVATGTAAAFMSAYNTAPTYSIADGTVTKTATLGNPALTDAGTIIVLFQWDGTSALVKDVDMMIAGVPSATNALISKSGFAQGGSTYATDANTIAAQPTAPASGTSTKRIARETGQEVQAGTGNGITGDDETSEHTNVTWDTTFTAPTPGQIPATL